MLFVPVLGCLDFNVGVGMMFGVCHLNMWVVNGSMLLLLCDFKCKCFPIAFASSPHPEILQSACLWFHFCFSFILFPCKTCYQISFQASLNKLMDLSPIIPLLHIVIEYLHSNLLSS